MAVERTAMHLSLIHICLQNIKLDMDTILVLVIVWFLLKDGEEIDWEQLLLIGALLILGI